MAIPMVEKSVPPTTPKGAAGHLKDLARMMKMMTWMILQADENQGAPDSESAHPFLDAFGLVAICHRSSRAKMTMRMQAARTRGRRRVRFTICFFF